MCLHAKSTQKARKKHAIKHIFVCVALLHASFLKFRTRKNISPPLFILQLVIKNKGERNFYINSMLHILTCKACNHVYMCFIACIWHAFGVHLHACNTCTSVQGAFQYRTPPLILVPISYFIHEP